MRARLARATFSFPAMLACSLALLAMLTVRLRFNDPDLWWHLRTGQIIAAQGIPKVDLLSFTTGQHEWVAHEWLFQLVLYGAWKTGGFPGLMLWFCGLSAALLLVEFRLCSLASNNSKIGFLGALIAWYFATIGLALRPQLLGYLLFACELVILELGRSGDARWFVALPALLALWANCHGSFLLGLIWLVLVWACGWRDGQAGLIVWRRLDPARRRILTWATALSLPAVLVNPVGFPLLTYPLRTLFDSRMQLDAVSEWRRLAFDDPRAFGLLAIAGTIFAVALVRRTPLFLEESATLGLVLAGALAHQRLVFVWGIAAAPVLCRVLGGLWERYEPAQDRRVWNAALMLGAAGMAWAMFPSRSELVGQIERANPTGAVEYLRRAQLPGNMLNDYVFGGYLAWNIPERKIFIDGRGDVFAWTGVLGDYGRWATLEADPNELLDRYAIAYCVLARSAPMARVLGYLPGWHELYSDAQAVIFARDPARCLP